MPRHTAVAHRIAHKPFVVGWPTPEGIAGGAAAAGDPAALSASRRASTGTPARPAVSERCPPLHPLPPGGSSRSTLAGPARFRGRAGPCARRSSRSRSTVPGWSGGSTSTATTRPTVRPTAANTARCTSTSWTPTATGSGQLGRSDFTYGQFGENFTVEGLADDEVCIGDRYRIGGATFEVTQPRVTCFRLGIRMNEPLMPSLLVAHHRPGFYLRVLEEGPVQAGDAIEPRAARARAAQRRRDRRAALPARALAPHA